MHVITREVNQGLVIDNRIQVTVLDVREDRVRLAITSPDDIPSYWEETLYLEPAEESDSELEHTQLQFN